MSKKTLVGAFVLVLFIANGSLFAQSGGSAGQIEYSVIVTYIPYTRTDSGRDAQRNSSTDQSSSSARGGYQSESYSSSGERSNSRENSNSRESERSFQEQSGKQYETVINVWASSVSEAERLAQDRFLVLYRDSGNIQYQFVSAKVKMEAFIVTIRYTLANDDLVLSKRITLQASSAQEAEREARQQWDKTNIAGNVFKGISSQKQN